MEYADLLAMTCVAARMAKNAAPIDPIQTRSRFEESADKETVLRDYAERMKKLMEQRQEDEPQGLGDYASAAAEKVLPSIPSSGTEALMRGSGAMVGGALGHQIGANLSAATPEAVQRITSGVDPKAMERLAERIKALKTSPAGSMVGSEDLVNLLKTESPERISKALGMLGGTKLPAKTPDVIMNTVGKLLPSADPRIQKIHSTINKVLGPEGVSRLRSEIHGLYSQVGKDVLKGSKPVRIGGGIAGALTGAAVMGLPFAVKAIYDKMRGGEGAVYARGKMRDALAESQELSKSRDKMLRQLEASSGASTTTV